MDKAVSTNADSFAKLVSEIRQKYPLVKDVYYSTHTGTWSIKYNEQNQNYPDSDHETFEDVLIELRVLFEISKQSL